MGGIPINEKQIFIVTTGYVPAYKKVRYKFGEKEFPSWFSSEALLNFVFDNPKDVHVVVVHPDNEAANKAYEEGFKSGEERLTEDRPSIKSIFSGCASVYQIKVKDEKKITEGDLLAAFSELDDIIDSIGYPAKITYDLTHSYRHLAFVILLQSFYLQTLKKGRVEIKEIFYAFAKQPLQEMDKVSYIDLGQLFLTILNTQVIKDAIHELRPFPLKRYADEIKNFKKFLRQIEYSIKFVYEVEKKIIDISRKLFLLQNGFFEVPDLVRLEKSLRLKNDPLHEWDHFIERFVTAFFGELKVLLKGFKNETGFFEKHQIMLELAKIVFKRQDDINKAYAFLRESIVQYFVDKMHIDVMAGDKSFSKFTNQNLKVPKELLETKNLLSQIGDTRNELQHLGMGKEPSSLSTYEKNFKKHWLRLNNLFRSENHELIQFIKKTLLDRI